MLECDSMTPKEHLIAALKSLCEREGGHVVVADEIKANDQTLYQIVTGVKLPSGNPRGVGPELQRKLDARYPGWANLPPASTAQPASGASASRPVAQAESAEAPDGYVRLENLSPEPAMGDGALVDEPVQVVRHLDVWEQWLRLKVGSTNPERIRVLTAKGRSMLPTIQDQDLVFVDVWQREIREPGIYVIDVAGRLLLKKALIQSTGTLILRSDNVDEYPDEERHDLKKAADTISVAGRVLAWWTLRRG